MAKGLHKLNALQIPKLGDGRHGDGGGLCLDVDGNRRRWIFRFRDRGTGKLREMGLGASSGADAVTLARAREKAAAARQALKDGRDPILAAREALRPTTVPTFGEAADALIASMESGWRNDKHKAQWRMTLTEYAKPLRDKPVDQISVEDVLAVLTPIWRQKPETAGRLRGRIERVLNAAKAAGHRRGENPAAWRGHLENLLPRRHKLTRGHHAALPWADVPDFMGELRQREGVTALALEFAILTAARSGEVRGAVWSELDLDAATWTIPAIRMKGGRTHRVPLVARAAEIVREMAKLRTEPTRDGYVFPGARAGKAISDASLAAVLRRMKHETVTVHGFRSSFKDWATEATSYANELSEAALAHVHGDKTELAYRRGDALARRRKLMEAWAGYLDKPSAGNVVSLARREASK